MVKVPRVKSERFFNVKHYKRRQSIWSDQFLRLEANMSQIKEKVFKNIEIAKKMNGASGSSVSKSTGVEMTHFWFDSAVDE